MVPDGERTRGLPPAAHAVGPISSEAMATRLPLPGAQATGYHLDAFLVNVERPHSILILPGMNGSGEGHWQTAWERLLPRSRRLTGLDWDHPVCTDWAAALERSVTEGGRDVVLVAHSLGCLQVAHWAAQTQLSVRAALLVAPPDPEGSVFPSGALGFAPLPLSPLRFPSTVVASVDDPFATIQFSQRCAEVWGSRFVNIGMRGHINSASNLGDWPEGQRILSALI
jgi:hypothetical protein